MATSLQKWLISIAVGLLFVIISLPWTYSLTNSVTASFAPTLSGTSTSAITPFGYILHTIVFILVTRLILVFY